MTGRSSRKITVNRAPVLTLWAAVVAERLGFDREEALTLGRAVAGLNAYSKGVSLGIFQPTPEAVRQHRKKLRKGGSLTVGLLGRAVPVARTPGGMRALARGRPADPAAVTSYLESKFGDALPRVRAAMARLARALPAKELNARAYALYEKFRPAVPAGTSGWGAKGELDLARLEALAR